MSRYFAETVASDSCDIQEEKNQQIRESTQEVAEKQESLSPAAIQARAVIRAVIRAGIRDFVLCPGSRSAPLAIALAQAEAAQAINLYVETDERVAGFIALGMGKAGKPAAVVTTSGSAVANLHPAVEEAFYSAVPLLVLSADRPHELRGVRASQTTNQTQVLRASLLESVDLPANLPNLQMLANQVRRGLRICLGLGYAGANGPGPVQINIAFTPPLDTVLSPDITSILDPGLGTEAENAINMPGIQGSHSCWKEARSALQMPINAKLAGREKRTVIVSGPSSLGNGPEFAEYSASLIGFIPVLAEAGSALRRLPQAMTAHPQLLCSKLGAQIERVIVIGHPTLTREVTSLLSRADIEIIVVDESPGFTDISGRAIEIIDISQIGAYASVDLTWFKEWERACRKARAEIHAYMQTVEEKREKSAVGQYRMHQTEIAIALAQSSVTTFYAASSIVREVNLYGSCAIQDVFVNRGLAGIDGNISTAIGIAYARQEPVRIALGDLAFIHDLGALVCTIGERRHLDLQVVLLDDGGGSLFATLEYGEGDEQIFERVFRTAKEFDFVHYATALGTNVRFTELSGTEMKLKDFFAQKPQGVEIVYCDLRGEKMAQIRAQRQYLREQINAALEF